VRDSGAAAGSSRSENMPTYEFHCEKCNKNFEQIWSLAEYDKRIKAKTKCPRCASTRVTKVISVVEVKTSKKS
jgi:putative FmdB family regulatory protein